MTETLRRTGPAALVTVLALLYAWVGVVATGADRWFGLLGGLVILAALAIARRFAPAAALALLVVGALPLAVATWWSIATPVLAALVLGLGWFAIRSLSQPQRDPNASVATDGVPVPGNAAVADGPGRAWFERVG